MFPNSIRTTCSQMAKPSSARIQEPLIPSIPEQSASDMLEGERRGLGGVGATWGFLFPQQPMGILPLTPGLCIAYSIAHWWMTPVQ